MAMTPNFLPNASAIYAYRITQKVAVRGIELPTQDKSLSDKGPPSGEASDVSTLVMGETHPACMP